jgi:hypothetical protein
MNWIPEADRGFEGVRPSVISVLAMGGDNRLRMEIDGPGVTPETIDPLATLELGASYLRLLQRLAKEAEHTIAFTGLGVEDKCAALVFTPKDPRVAELLAVDADKILSGERLVAPRLNQAVDGFLAAVRALPTDHSVTVLVGTRRLLVTRERAASASVRRSITKLRATLVMVGGTKPSARLSSGSEARAFTVRVNDQAAAQRLGPHIYQELDVELELERDENGLIRDGLLLAFTPLSQAPPPAEQWRVWFQDAGGAEWGTVEDIELELGLSETGQADG